MLGAAAMVVFAGALALSLPDEAQEATPRALFVQEDSPLWNCRTMGNHACGVATGGVRYVIQYDATGETPVSVSVLP